MAECNFEEGLNLSFRINDLVRDVTEYLEKHGDGAGSYPIMLAEMALHKVVSRHVHKQFVDLAKADPDIFRKAKEMGIPDEKIRSMQEEVAEDGVSFEPVK